MTALRRGGGGNLACGHYIKAVEHPQKVVSSDL